MRSGLSEVKRITSTRGAPRFDGTDRFVIDGNELLPCEPVQPSTSKSPSCKYPDSASLQAFTTMVETYERIAFDSSVTGGAWYVWDPSGAKRTYLPARDTPSWEISHVQDSIGNAVDYTYNNSAPNSPDLLERIE